MVSQVSDGFTHRRSPVVVFGVAVVVIMPSVVSVFRMISQLVPVASSIIPTITLAVVTITTVPPWPAFVLGVMSGVFPSIVVPVVSEAWRFAPVVSSVFETVASVVAISVPGGLSFMMRWGVLTTVVFNRSIWFVFVSGFRLMRDSVATSTALDDAMFERIIFL